MKHFLLFVLLFLLTYLGFAQTLYQVDEKRIYDWDGAPDWDHVITEQFTYDNGGNKETKIVGLSYPSSENIYQFIKSYNSNNDIILSVRQSWNSTTMLWENVSQDVYTYFTNTSNIKDVTTYSFNLGFDVFKISYEYSGSDVSKITVQQEAGGSLVNYEQYVYTYNIPGQPYQEFDSIWNTTTSMWDLKERGTATYSTNLREVINEKYNGSTYDLFEKYITTYSGSLETQYIIQTWNGSSYINSDRELSTYDANDNKTVYIFESWLGSAWEGYYKEEMDYSIAAPLSTVSFDNNSFKIYPNPASNIINISSSLDIDKIEIYTVLGKKVLQTPYTKQLNVESLNTGIYLLKVFSNNQSSTRKIVIK